jgi:hypothetical protein
MKPLPSTVVALIAGCVLWWLGVQLSGILSALPWPAFVVTLSKSSKLQALYLWQVAVHFIPMCLAVGAASVPLFRVVGARPSALFAAVLPYILLNWATGSFERLFGLSGLALFGLSLIALLAFPLGVLVAWRLARHGNLTPPSSGHPPAGFAV